MKCNSAQQNLKTADLSRAQVFVTKYRIYLKVDEI